MDVKVLFLSFGSPPSITARAIQLCKLSRVLSIRPKIITAKESKKEFCPEFEKNMEVISRIQAKPQSGFIDLILYNLFKSYYLTPDANRVWAKKLYNKTISYLDNKEIKVIVSFSNPLSVHLSALKIKKKKNLPWVAFFSDPWTDNPYNVKKGLSKLVNKYLEKQVVKNADKLIFTSQETLNVVMRKYPKNWKEKAIHIPHMYDKSIYDYTLKPDKDRFVIRHLGEFYGIRTPEPFLEVINDLYEEKKELFDNVLIEFYGKLNNYNYVIGKYKDIKCISFKEPVNYHKSIDLMLTSDLLLSIDAPAKEESIFLPSKLVDYIGAKKPIFSITQKGTAYNLIREVDGYVASTIDSTEIKETVLDILLNIKKIKSFTPNENYYKYDAEEVIKKFEKVLEDVNVN